MHKIFNSNAPKYLLDRIHTLNVIRTTSESLAETSLSLKLEPILCTEVFLTGGVKVWNRLPMNMKGIGSLERFRSHLRNINID